jgi:hypothetical protein
MRARGNTSNENRIDPLRLVDLMNSAPRCGAHSRRTGLPCRGAAVRGNARCRMHGGKGSGPPRGNRNAQRHGRFSAKSRAFKFMASMLAWTVDGDERREAATLSNERDILELLALLWAMGAAEAKDGGRDDLQRVAVSVAKQAGLRWVPPVGK